MSISPDKWKKVMNCTGMTAANKGVQYRTGCKQEFTVTFFDIYRVTNWLNAALSMGSDYSVLANCPHCGQPNHIPYSFKLHSQKDSDKSELSNVDKRYVDKIPFKFKRFFSKY